MVHAHRQCNSLLRVLVGHADYVHTHTQTDRQPLTAAKAKRTCRRVWPGVRKWARCGLHGQKIAKDRLPPDWPVPLVLVEALRGEAAPMEPGPAAGRRAALSQMGDR